MTSLTRTGTDSGTFLSSQLTYFKFSDLASLLPLLSGENLSFLSLLSVAVGEMFSFALPDVNSMVHSGGSQSPSSSDPTRGVWTRLFLDDDNAY